MWYFPHPETAIPLEEPADPRGSRSYRRIVDSGWEKCHIFWKKTQILFEFDSFFGVESGPFFAEKSVNFFGVSIFLHSPQIFCGLFRKRKLPLSTPKNESNLTKNRDILEKMWFFPHPETAILPLERLPWGSASSYRRIAVRGWDKCHIFSQKSQYLVKFDSFFGVEIGNFFLFLGTPAGPWDDLPTRIGNDLWLLFCSRPWQLRHYEECSRGSRTERRNGRVFRRRSTSPCRRRN